VGALACSLGTPVVLASVAFVVLRFGGQVADAAVLVWQMAVVGKHRICPPITIVRARHAS